MCGRGRRGMEEALRASTELMDAEGERVAATMASYQNA